MAVEFIAKRTNFKMINNKKLSEMKKIVITVSTIILLFLTGCASQKEESEQESEVKKLSEYENTDFLPTLEHQISAQKNSVYCVTLLYAWEQIRKQINQPLIISEKYNDLLLLNNSKSFVNVLKSNEYSASGTIDGDVITAKAEFKKSLPFRINLNSYDNKLTFKGKPVASFGVSGHNDCEQKNIVQIFYYKNDDNFIIALLPKDKKHEIILFKTDKVFNSMAEMNKEIRRLTEIGIKEWENEKLQWKYWFSDESDVLIIPKINFNIATNYSSLEGKEFRTAKQDYQIETAWQRTAFRLDERGAEVVSEVKVYAVGIREEEQPRPKKMIFDKDFLILLKRTDSQNPYFGLWVVNTELMIEE